MPSDPREGLVRLVLDTNIVVSALLWGGVPRQILDLQRENRVTLFSSSGLLDELNNVLKREKFSKLLSSQKITPRYLMQRYGTLVNLVTPATITPTVRDSDDDIVIATALAARADVISTGDSDLLVLHSWRGIKILDAADTIQLVQGGEDRATLSDE